MTTTRGMKQAAATEQAAADDAAYNMANLASALGVAIEALLAAQATANVIAGSGAGQLRAPEAPEVDVSSAWDAADESFTSSVSSLSDGETEVDERQLSIPMAPPGLPAAPEFVLVAAPPPAAPNPTLPTSDPAPTTTVTTAAPALTALTVTAMPQNTALPVAPPHSLPVVNGTQGAPAMLGPPLGAPASRWYTVTRGSEPGVYSDWSLVALLVIGVLGAVFLKHPTEASARMAYINAWNQGLVKRV